MMWLHFCNPFLIVFGRRLPWKEAQCQTRQSGDHLLAAVPENGGMSPSFLKGALDISGSTTLHYYFLKIQLDFLICKRYVCHLLSQSIKQWSKMPDSYICLLSFLFLPNDSDSNLLLSINQVFMYSLNSAKMQGTGTTLVNKTKSLSSWSLQNHLWLIQPSTIIILGFLGVLIWPVQYSSKPIIHQNISLNTWLLCLLSFV